MNLVRGSSRSRKVGQSREGTHFSAMGFVCDIVYIVVQEIIKIDSNQTSSVTEVTESSMGDSGLFVNV